MYVRSNITKIDEEDTEDRPGFHGWEYDETQMTIPEYILQQQNTITNLGQQVTNLIIGG